MVAYNLVGLKNLHVQKEVKRWMKQDLISADQNHLITSQYPCAFYHPNFLIRILLFAATILGASGATGLMLVMVDSSNETSISIPCIINGALAVLLLEFFIREKKHYKSGLTEALLYYAAALIIGGFIILFDADNNTSSYIIFIILAVAAIRYIDLIATIGALLSFAYIVFNTLYIAGGIAQQVIPFVMMIVFLLLYFQSRKLKNKEAFQPWYDVLLTMEGISLLIVYCGGNYFVVRELSIDMTGLYLEDGQDIPFAMLFYCLTIIIPVAYLYFGIKLKDIVLIRVSLVVIACTVFTFKYYFSLGHPEITLTIAGAILIAVSLALLNYLKVIRNGFTRENHLPEKWADMNLEAAVISQTLGGNQVTVEDAPIQRGGDFGGGGSSDGF
jgi:hypothetical protein